MPSLGYWVGASRWTYRRRSRLRHAPAAKADRPLGDRRLLRRPAWSPTERAAVASPSRRRGCRPARPAPPAPAWQPPNRRGRRDRTAPAKRTPRSRVISSSILRLTMPPLSSIELALAPSAVRTRQRRLPLYMVFFSSRLLVGSRLPSCPKVQQPGRDRRRGAGHACGTLLGAAADLGRLTLLF